MADLAAGVYSRVGAAGDDQLDRMTGDQGQLFLQNSRDRAQATGLRGPAVKIRAVVGDIQADAHQVARVLLSLRCIEHGRGASFGWSFD